MAQRSLCRNGTSRFRGPQHLVFCDKPADGVAASVVDKDACHCGVDLVAVDFSGCIHYIIYSCSLQGWMSALCSKLTDDSGKNLQQIIVVLLGDGHEMCT